MRINKFVAQSTGLSRRKADEAILQGRVTVNGHTASQGQDVSETDDVVLDGRTITPAARIITMKLNKPVGYVVSRDGQGSNTVYNLLPPQVHHLKPVGRLDKDSSGLLLLTNDGQLAQELTHPKFQKTKVYEVELNKPLAPEDKAKIEQGVEVEDYVSHLQLQQTAQGWQVIMSEGKNRQIRRTFAALGYKVTKLHRTHFGKYKLADLQTGMTTIATE